MELILYLAQLQQLAVAVAHPLVMLVALEALVVARLVADKPLV